MKNLTLKTKIVSSTKTFAISGSTLASAGNIGWSFLQTYKLEIKELAIHTKLEEASASSSSQLLVGKKLAKSLHLNDGESVTLSVSRAQKATSIQVENAEDTDTSIPLFEGLELTVGNIVHNQSQTVRIKACDPAGSFLSPSTTIEIINEKDGETVRSGQFADELPTPGGFSELVAIDDVVDQIRHEILLPINQPELAEKFMGSKLKGAILHGPYGIAKTKVARALAAEANVGFIQIPVSAALNMFGPSYIESCYRKAASQKQGAIIFFDELDAIAPRGSNGDSVTTTIQECMDGFKNHKNVFTLATTNHLNNIAMPLLRGGRFDLIIEMKLPDKNDRVKLWKFFTQKLQVDSPLDYESLAGKTAAYSGADIESVVKQAGITAFKKAVRSQPDIRITQKDIEEKLSECTPTGERVMGVTTPKVRFEDLFGIDSLVDEVMRRLDLISGKKPAKLSRVKNMPMLLYGPPGTGKTSFAQAVANYLEVSFVYRSATNFKDKWFGESERKIREIFNLGRTYSPLVIFIDEIDGLGAKRTGQNPHTEGLLSEFLNEMESVAGNDGVYIIGATNRKDKLDEALLSRFGYQFEMPNPDYNQRIQVINGIFGEFPPEILEIDPTQVATLMTGWSQRDIAGLAEEIRMKFDLGEISKITTSSLQKLIKTKHTHTPDMNQLQGVNA